METVSIREIAATETVRWLDIGEYAGRPVLRQWEQVGDKARIVARYWLEPVSGSEGR